MTWANQVRVLRQQFQALGAVIGQGLIQALKPALIAFNAFLSRVIEFAKQVLNALGKIFGWKVDISGGGLDTDLSEAEDAATGLGDALGGASDNAGDAADNVKELKKQLQGFDKLNVLTTTETGGGSGGSGGGGGGSGSGGGGGGAGSSNDLAVNLQKTEGLFESNINSLRELGVYIRNSLMDAMDNIPWDSIYEKARGFGSGLASFLNGLFSGSGESNVFASLGRTVAGAINTALNFFDSFADVFDFSTFGRNLASFFVEAVSNIDWSLAGEAFHEWMQGIKDAFKAFVDYLWEHRDEVFKAIKDFLSEITIEDIAIFIGIMTISKIGKWVLAGGVLELSKKAIGALFKDIGIAITAKITGLSFAEASALGAKGLIGELIGSNGLITNAIGLALMEGTGAATVGGALATFALPIAFAITPLIFHKILRNMYEDAKEEGDEIKQGIIENAFGKKASVTRRRTEDGEVYDVELGAVINWKLLFGKLTDKLPWKGQGFFKWLGEKMFPKTVSVNGEEVEINYFGSVGFGLGDGKKFEFPWKGKGFFKWLAEKLFPKTVKTTNGEDFSIDYDIDISFNLGEKFGSGKFKTWLEEKIGVKNGESVTTAGITGIFNGWEQVKGGGALSDAWSYVKGWFKDHDFVRNWKPWSYIKGWFNSHGFASGWGSPWSYIKGWFNNWDWNKGWSPWSYIKGWFKGWDWASGWSPWSYIKGWFKNWDTVSGWSPWSYIKGWFKNWDFASGWNPWSYIKGWFKNWDYAKGWNPWSYIKGFFKNAQGGVLTASGWKPIQQYASGGMPTYGQVFVAREAGPELVGTLGGHTAVMNNDQIVSSVAAGVANANMAQNQLLAEQNALLRQILAKETGISSRDLFNAVRSENNNYINRTGNSAFA